MSNIYIKDGVSKSAIIDFLKFERNNDLCQNEIQAFSVIRKGELLCRIALPPYDTSDNRQLFSLSKSFCSTAVGFAVDEGLFKVTDRIIDIFPDDCPEVISERLAKMTVHNVLTMGTGHKSCVMNSMIYSENPVRAFMEQELSYEPGEKFVYNTGATLLASIIVQRFTGKTVYDYLYEKLFRYLPHTPEKWDMIPTGYCEGGVGLYASIEDIENLGKLYLGKGVLYGRRFLSEEWINAASACQIENPDNGSPDWCSGYGYQFWRNSREGYRGDGACGQLCVVLPSTETIICIQCEAVGAMQGEMNGVYTLADSIEGEDKVTEKELVDFIESFYTPEKCDISEFYGFGKKYAVEDNLQNIKYIDFENRDNDVIVNLYDAGYKQTIIAKCNEYTHGSLLYPGFKPSLYGLCPVKLDVCKYSCYISECTKNTLAIHMRYRNANQSDTLVFQAQNGELKMQHNCRTMDVPANAKVICGKEI